MLQCMWAHARMAGRREEPAATTARSRGDTLQMHALRILRILLLDPRVGARAGPSAAAALRHRAGDLASPARSHCPAHAKVPFPREPPLASSFHSIRSLLTRRKDG